MATLQNCVEIDLAPLNQDSGDKLDIDLGDTTDTSLEDDDTPLTSINRPRTPFPNTPSTLPYLQTDTSNDYLRSLSGSGSIEDNEASTVETQSSLATKLKALIMMIKLGNSHTSPHEQGSGIEPDRLSYATTVTSRTTSQTSMTIVPYSSLPSIPLSLCNSLMLHPTGVGIQYWNMIICLVVVYNLIFLPIRFAFPYFQERLLPFWYFLDILADLYYLLDIAIQLRTSYLEQGCIVEDWKPIALHYISSKIFLLDVITIFPLDIFRVEDHTTAYHNYIIFLRFIRFLKAYKILIFVDRIEARSDKPNIIRIVAQVILLITIIHINACIYFLISTFLGYGSGPFSWAYPGRTIRKPLNANGSLLDVAVPDYATLDQYLNCLHWSTQMLTTIGEVNAPSVHIEYIYATILLLFGVLMFATLVGNVGTIITNLNAARTRFESRLDNVKQYMDDRNINKVLKESVLRWFDHLWEKSRGIDEQETLQNLPNKLRARIAFNANRKILSDNPIYNAGDEGFKIDLMVRFRSELFPPNEKIYEKGHIGNEMYIIRTGTVELTNRDDGQSPIEIEEGKYFGISCIINFDEFGGERSETATTIGFCDLLVLEKKDLLELLVDYPNVKVKLDQQFVHSHKQGRGAENRIEIQDVSKYVEKLSSHYDNLEREFQRLSAEHDRLQARYPNITI